VVNGGCTWRDKLSKALKWYKSSKLQYASFLSLSTALPLDCLCRATKVRVPVTSNNDTALQAYH
jgi:hypothetical protein